MAVRRAPSGARTHFFREAQARQAEQRREAGRAWGRKIVPKITFERARKAREMENSRRGGIAERVNAVRDFREFVDWAREKLAPKRRELEFQGVKLNREETGALRKLVNRERLSRNEEMLVGEALEKLVRKQGARKAA